MSEVWTVKRVLEWATGFLQTHGSESPRLDAQLLLGHVCGLDKVQLYVQFERPLLSGELAAFRDFIKRRAGAEPVAYILGKKELYGRSFSVDGRVLVPRPETEHLIDLVLAHVRGRGLETPHIVDVGVGSGTIAVTLAAELPGAVVLGVDLSPGALAVAAVNAEQHQVRERVKLVKGDALDPVRSSASVDVVVSNPPYLDDALMASLPRDVRDYEPHLALFGGADGLDVHRKLALGAARVLRPGGLLAVELSGDRQADEVAALWSQAFDAPVVTRDFRQISRVLSATRHA